MKCTRTITGGQRCGKETRRPVPPQLVKHQNFDPLVLDIFFSGTKDEKDVLPLLDAFVCPDCMPKWKERNKRSVTAKEAAAKRRQEDYSI